ncbi:DUF4252 domain-containing protein [Planktosalinus lacus]|uniref:DUF4252 domain-containing protein n=1 Tax=Planktosalinus lacus TaxID=1526573 RepID=A0A8J2VBX0_9FLAO|nr:DUF4252 domain-containing protein [Planktosalinus lacus]GGD99346.1 hypothetical protein GCM10011312_23570 [Planktosalinus lacus]
MKTFVITLSLFVAAVVLSSCSNNASLQKYYVDKQNDDAFISLDLPSSLILTEDNTLTEEQLETVKSIRKVNMLALELNETNKAVYESEKERVHTILSDEAYQTLIKYGSNNQGATLKFSGDDDAIDELIIFASDEEKGFALFRVIGDDMNPSRIMQLMDSVNTNNFDFSFMKDFGSALN